MVRFLSKIVEISPKTILNGVFSDDNKNEQNLSLIV